MMAASLQFSLERGCVPTTALFVGAAALPQEIERAACQALGIGPADTIRIDKAPKIDELRTVLHRANLRPLQGKQSLLILGRLDEWDQVVQTVLLKTIEEPPAHLIVFLAARQDVGILPTILSRAVRFRLPRAPQPPPAMGYQTLQGQSLQEQLKGIQEIVGEHSVQEVLAGWIATAPPAVQARLLAVRRQIGSTPVNKRLSLEAAFLSTKEPA